MTRARVRHSGMVTAELAAAFPVVVVVLWFGLAALRVAIDEVRCVDAARVAARALARGDAEAEATAAAIRAGPSGASVTSSVRGDLVTVVVTAERDLAGMRVLTVRGEATGVREQP